MRRECQIFLFKHRLVKLSANVSYYSYTPDFGLLCQDNQNLPRSMSAHHQRLLNIGRL